MPATRVCWGSNGVRQQPANCCQPAGRGKGRSMLSIDRAEHRPGTPLGLSCASQHRAAVAGCEHGAHLRCPHAAGHLLLLAAAADTPRPRVPGQGIQAAGMASAAEAVPPGVAVTPLLMAPWQCQPCHTLHLLLPALPAWPRRPAAAPAGAAVTVLQVPAGSLLLALQRGLRVQLLLALLPWPQHACPCVACW